MIQCDFVTEEWKADRDEYDRKKKFYGCEIGFDPWENNFWQVNFFDEGFLIGDWTSSAFDAGGEPFPGNDADEKELNVILTATVKKKIKHDVVHKRRHDWIQNPPEKAHVIFNDVALKLGFAVKQHYVFFADHLKTAISTTWNPKEKLF